MMKILIDFSVIKLHLFAENFIAKLPIILKKYARREAIGCKNILISRLKIRI